MAKPQKTPNPGKRKLSLREAFRTLLKVWAYLADHKRTVFLVMLMVLLSSGFGLLGPYLVGHTIDETIVARRTGMLPLLLGLLAGVYVLHSASLWLQNYWMIGAAQRTVYTMRQDLFRHLHRLPVSFFAKRQHGEIMSRITNDIENVSQTLNSSVIQLFSSVLTFVGMLGLMLWLSPLLTLITLTVVPAMFFGMKWITTRTSVHFKAQQKNIGSLNGFIEETLSGQKIVKSFSREANVIAEFRERNAALRTSGYWAQVYSGFIPKLMNVLNNLSFAIIAGAGGLLATRDLVSIGVIVTFTEYARQFIRPLNDLANQFNTFLSAVAGAERVFEVLDEEAEEADERDAEALAATRGEIEFRSVSFSYSGDADTLADFSFRVPPGTTAALVGPTGAGKTTIVQLLSRFYDADGGLILLDGRDIRTIKRQSLRRQMGFVLQDPFLFQGTIRDNIRYGRLEATDEEVERAAKEANAHGFIVKLPQGYGTVIGGDGGGLSQGQKQLLSIARALLADPALLILDEATSSIDTITELRIQEALYRLMKGRTNIVIAHRLNTIRRADQILVLEEGRLIEHGSHEELLRRDGFYAGLYKSQFREEMPSSG